MRNKSRFEVRLFFLVAEVDSFRVASGERSSGSVKSSTSGGDVLSSLVEKDLSACIMHSTTMLSRPLYSEYG
jgi:hypothetical protein